MIINIITIASFGLLAGVIIGLIIGSFRYPSWEVKKMFKIYKSRTTRKNEWWNIYEFANHTNHEIVKPNCDTLYSTIFINLDESDYKLKFPEMRNMYFSFTFLRSNTDVLGYINNRNAVGKNEFILTNKKGISNHEIPVKYLNTKLCWIIARFGVSAIDNIPEINKLQKKLVISNEY
ncbi:MAG: DUF1254 domain-containing protein [Bacteroidota bacterium]